MLSEGSAENMTGVASRRVSIICLMLYVSYTCTTSYKEKDKNDKCFMTYQSFIIFEK
jgi:hypothetical protein